MKKKSANQPIPFIEYAYELAPTHEQNFIHTVKKIHKETKKN